MQINLKEAVKNLRPYPISRLQSDVKHLLEVKKFGHEPTEVNFWKRLSLAHTELSEIADLVKKQGFDKIDMEDLAEEVADVIIRAMNFGVMFDLNMEEAIRLKMAKNFERPVLYGTHEQERSVDEEF